MQKSRIHINQLKAGVILSYIITAAEMVIQLVYTPVMLRLIGQSEYGLYNLVGSIVSYLSLFSLGFTGAYLRFYSRYKVNNDEFSIAKLNGLFLSLFTLMSIVALVCGWQLTNYSYIIFGNRITAEELTKAKILMIILVFNIALTFPSSIFNSIIGSKEKFFFQRIVSLIGVLFDPLICLPLLIMGYGSVVLVSVTTFITLFKLVVNAIYCLKVLKTRFVFRDFDISLIKEISNFSFFIFLNMIIDQINWSVDKIILGREHGTTAVAIYGVGATINTVYTRFSTAISSVFSPRINRIAAEKADDQNRRLSDLLIKVGRIQFFVLMLIVSGFVFWGRYFITDIYTSAEYDVAYYVTMLLIIPVTIPLIQNLGLEIQRALNKHQFRSKIYLLMAICNIVLSIPLARKYGPTGAAVGTAISLMLANGIIMNWYYSCKLGLDIKKFWTEMGTIFLKLLPAFIFGVIIKIAFPTTSILVFVMSIIIYSAIYFACAYYWGMNQYEQGIVRRITQGITHIHR